MNLLWLLLRNHLRHKESAKLFFGGKTNMLRQPEFHDVDKIQLSVIND